MVRERGVMNIDLWSDIYFKRPVHNLQEWQGLKKPLVKDMKLMYSDINIFPANNIHQQRARIFKLEIILQNDFSISLAHCKTKAHTHV